MAALPIPPNASAMARALAVALALPSDITDAPDVIKTRFENPTDDELPFLIWEWDLQGVLPYLPDPRTALREGRKWQKTRGTISAGHTARGWLDVVAEHEQEVNKLYHLHLKTLATGNVLSGVIELSRLSQSLRSHLHRITYKLDHRALLRSQGKRAHTIRANSSGIRFRADWPILSFREFLSSHTALETSLPSNSELVVSIVDRTSVKQSIVRGKNRKPRIAGNVPATVTGQSPHTNCHSIVGVSARVSFDDAPWSYLPPDNDATGTGLRVMSKLEVF